MCEDRRVDGGWVVLVIVFVVVVDLELPDVEGVESGRCDAEASWMRHAIESWSVLELLLVKLYVRSSDRLNQ